MGKNALIFDMDGVLFDTERLYMEAWRKTARSMGLKDMESVVFGCVGLNYTDTKSFFQTYYGNDFPFDDYMKECSAWLDRKIKAEGLPVKPGVRELLAYLEQESYLIGLASSTKRKRVLENLEEAGIRNYFRVIVGGDMVAHGKPSPDIYQTACRELDVCPRETFAVEDSTNGVYSAHSAGMKVIMVPDMIQPPVELDELLYIRCRNLTEVKYALMGRKITRIPFQGLGNTRDLGGMPTSDGGRIRPGRLLRSGALQGSTGEDRRILVEEYGLRTVVDLRTAAERAGKPDPELAGVKNIWNPVLAEETLGITHECGPGERDVVREVAEKVASPDGGAEAYMRAMYADLIRKPYSRKQYREFFRILLEREEGGVLWHCSAGKDRAGVAAALVLSALGVERELVIADYMKTNEFGKNLVASIMGKLSGSFDLSTRRGKDAFLSMRLLFTVEDVFLKSVLEQIDGEFGGMGRFLEEEMGLTPEKQKKLRGLYVE